MLMVVAGLFVAIITDTFLWIISPELKSIIGTYNSIFSKTLTPLMLRNEIVRDLAYNVPTLFGLAAVIKFGKHWYQKQKERELLIKEKLKAELQLLKAQIHPHFLFNTLNNIYSFILTSNPNASGLILKLSNLLRYILTECNQPKVPLVKELKMIENYMELEKIRYGERLNMQVTVVGNPENKSIAPLLLLPFIENSFKHGASNVLQNPWIELNLIITDQNLSMELVNSQVAVSQAYDKNNGIGLANVQKRLNLLYGNQHTLKISTEREVFKIQLTVGLTEIAVISEDIVDISYFNVSAV
ncbi:sensor histidine kinase [Solitalea canadensis]|nr:histidine kinase [Solitalea canadensis]